MPGTVVRIQHEGEAGEARRVAVTIAGQLGFSEERCGKVALVATEAARNIALHAGQGEMIITPLDQDGVGGVELLALDKGRGMADIDKCMRDGYTTAGTGGVGLGAIARMSDVFDIYSQPDAGTAVLARLWASRPPRQRGVRMEVGAVSVAKAGEEACGDCWSALVKGQKPRFLVCDGLGHGPGASTASLAAARVFHARPQEALPELVRAAHDALRPTRGAALSVTEVDLEAGTVTYVGVGNIVSMILRGESRQNLISLNGTVGHQMPKVQAFSYSWPAGALLVMHSDGLGTQWRLDRYPGLMARNPSLVAGVLYRDFNRGRDDSTVLVAREQEGEGGA
ncbi:MAG TPA: ATP-binding SpoIIE family protein phosphatase [Myxococcaceae bacterium]|nr:ATP-binding SpoIIE family protein phosphatase [Myxococcaceae bacterium]